MNIRFASLAAGLLAFSAHAAKPAAVQAPAAWPEPTTFLGLNLGAPVAAQSALIACPKKPLYQGSTSLMRDYSDKRFCYERPQWDDVSFWDASNGPELGFGYSTSILVRDGEVHGVHLRLTREGAPQFLEMLTSRFGQPTTVRTESYQNKLGAQYSGKVFTWEGKTVRMELSEVGSRVTESTFELVTREYEAREKALQDSKAVRFKDRL